MEAVLQKYANEEIDKHWSKCSIKFSKLILKPEVLKNKELGTQAIKQFIADELILFEVGLRTYILQALIDKCGIEINKYKETSLDYLPIFDPYDETYCWTDFYFEWHNKTITVDQLPTMARDLRRVLAYMSIDFGKAYQKITSDEPVKLISKIGKIFTINIKTIVETNKGPVEKIIKYNIDKLRDTSIYKYFTYGTSVFNPYSPAVKNPETKYFNTFYGFKAKLVVSVKNELIKPILHHIKTDWANNDDDWNHWILSWLSYIIKTPWLKTLIALVLISKPGARPDILLAFFEKKVIGSQHAITLNGFDKATQRFDSITRNKIFITVNALSSDNKKDKLQRIKLLITELKRTMEYKFNETGYVKDCSNWLLESDHYNPIFFNKDQQFFACTYTSNEYHDNYEYLNQLESSLTQEAADHFLTYLYTYPSLDIHNFTLIPPSNIDSSSDDESSDESSNDESLEISTPLLFMRSMVNCFIHDDISSNPNKFELVDFIGLIPKNLSGIEIVKHNVTVRNERTKTMIVPDTDVTTWVYDSANNYYISKDNLYTIYRAWAEIKGYADDTKYKFNKEIKKYVEKNNLWFKLGNNNYLIITRYFPPREARIPNDDTTSDLAEDIEIRL